MRISTGIDGLDKILCGGFISSRAYLVQGEPGTGKTMLGLHFLAAGLGKAERGLLISFSESEERIRSDASELGLKLDHVKILDLTPTPDTFSEMETYDIFSPVEVEREPATQEIARGITETSAQRIFVDGFGQFQQLASDLFHQRRLVQSFFRFATQRGTTLLVASEDRASAGDADGVIRLELDASGRSIGVTKFRGSDFHAGRHPMQLTGKGLQVLTNVA